ncbi:MAG: hypothetical protein IKY53_00385 [Lachnospiraceae bacterium]|nr:hypothetical protein [Lachnospiraceae bacterium]
MVISFVNVLLSFLLVLLVFVVAIAVAVVIGVCAGKILANAKEKREMEEPEEEPAK